MTALATNQYRVNRNNHVLVLNKAWTAISVKTLRSAFGLLFGEYVDGTPKARVIDTVGGVFPTAEKDSHTSKWIEGIIESEKFSTYDWSSWTKMRAIDENFVNTTWGKLRRPSVIQLTKYNKVPSNKVNFNRRELYRRDNNTCCYCGKKFDTADLTVEHILPRSRGGISSWTNCAISCWWDNVRKGNRTPEEAGMKILITPKEPNPGISRYIPNNPPKDWQDFISEMYWEIPLQD